MAKTRPIVVTATKCPTGWSVEATAARRIKKRPIGSFESVEDAALAMEEAAIDALQDKER